MEKLMEIFEKVSCSKNHLRKHLEKKSYTVWEKLDDMALKNEHGPEYAELLRNKGLEEIERRKVFLGEQLTD